MIRIGPTNPDTERLWSKLVELAAAFGPDEEWCLVGGLMVQLHAFEHGAATRPTRDIDVLGNARARPSGTKRLAEILDRLGASLADPPTTSPDTGYQFDLDGATIEVLGPDGLRSDPRTLGTFKTIQIDGGSQALQRTEKVEVSIGNGPGVVVRRPTLLGAILLKARAIHSVPSRLEDHRQDLIMLLSFVDDPRAIATEGELMSSERRWLRDATGPINFDDPVLQDRFAESAIRRARQTMELLIAQ